MDTTQSTGNGLLVLQQDLRAGEIEDNLVNSHPERAWLKVIEADGEQNMVQEPMTVRKVMCSEMEKHLVHRALLSEIEMVSLSIGGLMSL